MGRKVDEAHRWRRLVGGGALLLLPLAALPVIRKVDHSRNDAEGTLSADGLELEHHYINSLDGTPLHLTVTGSGEHALFLVHGWTCNESVFRYQQARFSREHKVVSLELRGHGASGVPAGLDYSHERFAEDLKAAIDYMDPGSFVTGGFSMGGFTALKFHELFAEEYAGRLKGMVLIDSSGLDLADGVLFGRAWKLLYPFPLSPALDLLGRPSGFSDRIMQSLKNTSFAYVVARLLAFGRRPCGAYVEHQREMSFSTSFSTACLAVKSMLQYHVEHHLPDVDVPVLLLVGEQDKLTSTEANRRTAELLPDARMKVFRAAGHDCLMERHREFNDELASFLAAVFGP